MSADPVYITRIACCLPGEPVSNEEMERLLGRVGGQPSRARAMTLRSNGIKSRHYAIDKQTLQPTHSNATLTAEAVAGLAGDGFEPARIECLVTGTSMADQLMPNHGVMVHGALGIPPCEIVSTTGVCVSGMSAMKYAYLAVAAGQCRNAVATGSELASAVMHARHFDAEHRSKVGELTRHPEIAFEKDFLRWMLSDAAGAVLLQPEPAPGRPSLKIEWMDIRSYANEMEACMYAGAEKIDGELVGWQRYDSRERAERSVMAVKQDVKLLNDNVIHYTLEKPLAGIARSRNLRPADIDWFVPHYSSEYFRDKVYRGLQRIDFEIPYEKWFTNLQTRGNTGSAAVYVMLEELFNTGRLSRGERILCYVPESGRFSSCFALLTVV